jgi:mRNA interferase MazF
MTTASSLKVVRGDIWLVNFDPTQGQEIQKTRPAIVMNIQAAWRLRLHIVIPITSWQPKFANNFWMIPLQPTKANGLDKESAANAFQIKSVSEDRFVNKVGVLALPELDAIAGAVVICIGFKV